MTGPGRARAGGHARARACSRGRPDGVEVVTFGCRLNTAESEAMRRHAEAAGLDDVVIVNTCAVTAEATRQARQAIRRLGARQPAGAHRRHRLRGADRARRPSPRCRRSRASSATHEKMQAETWAALKASARRRQPSKIARRRHHGGARDRRASHRRHRAAAPAPSCRCRTAATTAAPSASSRIGRGNSRSRADGRRGRAGAAASSSTARARSC